ncbi:MAG: tRNA (cytidine(34)-2'-O)-methyltransferase [Eubacteriales bacterium]|nr:tRNA (cytidine(34)-2'-O)-methyltransferase [Eubacteriales bacterium]
MFHIALIEPEIPQNTGNIARLCSVTGTHLHLVKPLGFELSSARLKRAGLDYWDELAVTVYENLAEFLERNRGAVMFFASSKAAQAHTDVTYPDGAFLVFGKETHGLPESLLAAHYDRAVRIPMRPSSRCLNLSSSAAVILYEALRQTHYQGLTAHGELTGRGD